MAGRADTVDNSDKLDSAMAAGVTLDDLPVSGVCHFPGEFGVA